MKRRLTQIVDAADDGRGKGEGGRVAGHGETELRIHRRGAEEVERGGSHADRGEIGRRQQQRLQRRRGRRRRPIKHSRLHLLTPLQSLSKSAGRNRRSLICRAVLRVRGTHATALINKWSEG